MIEDKFVDLYARNSGLRDKLVAERDVVLTYTLRGLIDDGVMDHLAFKGGTCLRKMIFGSAGRFSEDLDFTLDSERQEDDVLLELVDSLNRNHYGISFVFDEYYKADSSRHDLASSGLGLSICKRIIEKHGGTITVNSAGTGQGTEVRFSLPKAKGPAALE